MTSPFVLKQPAFSPQTFVVTLSASGHGGVPPIGVPSETQVRDFLQNSLFQACPPGLAPIVTVQTIGPATPQMPGNWNG